MSVVSDGVTKGSCRSTVSVYERERVSGMRNWPYFLVWQLRTCGHGYCPPPPPPHVLKGPSVPLFPMGRALTEGRQDPGWLVSVASLSVLKGPHILQVMFLFPFYG